MTKGDLLVERGAQRLQQLAQRAASRGDGIGEWLAEELTADAAFLRKLKPSLIAARTRGDAATNQEAGTAPTAPSAPQLGPRPKKTRRRGSSGRSPLVVVGAALAAGILIAKVIDWRGHAHPRD
ncbi:MAG TPA: hypothetical protein VE753_09410 [Gaiellaceae bacterium]|jgi:hypothetical protein|nr:hypothetical protein [Gaiellaceae bacterium]